MRRARWLLVAAILLILGGVGVTYRLQRQALESSAPAKPPAMPLDINSSAEDWVWTQHEGDRPVVRISAKGVKQVKDSGRTDLDRVELRIFHKEGNLCDVVKSAHAEFTEAERRLYSEGEVEITLDVPIEGPPKRTPVSIRTSGVTFDSTTGKAVTGRETFFTFENGSGKALGASYDPSTKELRMASQAELDWRAPGSRPAKLEAGELLYKEDASTIWLRPWARLARDAAVVESGEAVVTLVKGHIRVVEARDAHGTDLYPRRQLKYAAANIRAEYGETGILEKMAAVGQARLVSTMEGGETTVTGDRVDMEFVESDGESALEKAVASGKAVVDSRPLPLPNRLMPESRVLRSETVEMKMRPGGREIEMVQTHAQGTLEFLPNRPNQHRRKLDAERMYITYGPQNQIQSFRAVTVATTTEPSAQDKKTRTASHTVSRNMSAQFSPKTGQMTQMQQWDDFRFEEGDRKARASRATMDSAANTILLEDAARMWDSTGSTSADRIQLDQATGNFVAAGHVNSSRLPDQKKKSSEMLSGDEPLQAKAETMRSENRNRLLHYEGQAILWQGANRIRADRVEIDREKRTLVGDGNVFTQLLEQNSEKQEAAKNRSNPGGFTTVKAAHMVYTESDRVAHYTGGVLLNRPNLQVKSLRLQAFLAESDADSRIEKAFADGNVEIVQTGANKCVHTGTSEHSEYYAGVEKIILRGGEPQLVDSCQGYTKGAELTYFVNDDRLQVIGAVGQPANSRIRRK